jgi:hypothetical protein
MSDSSDKQPREGGGAAESTGADGPTHTNAGSASPKAGGNTQTKSSSKIPPAQSPPAGATPAPGSAVK